VGLRSLPFDLFGIVKIAASGSKGKNMRSRHLVLALAGLCLFSVASAKAVTLVGTSVTGSVNVNGGSSNGFDPANGVVPSTGYLNSSTNDDSATVVISDSAIEFGAATASDTVTANFTDNLLTITDDKTSGGTTSLGGSMSFTDTSFGGITAMSTDTFPNGLTEGISGDVITVSWGGGTIALDTTYEAEFCITAVTPQTFTSVPTPASFGIGLLAIPMVGLWLVKRNKAKVA